MHLVPPLNSWTFQRSLFSAFFLVAFYGLFRKSHSFRIGGAFLAADRGYSDAQIRALGRWKSVGGGGGVATQIFNGDYKRKMSTDRR